MASAASKLFQPIRVGNVELKHRIVLAPLTRYRATKAHVPTDLMVDYYAQRASTPGGLLITEGTFIAARAGGYEQVPGIWSDEQVEGWKKVVDAVHAQGCFIYMQLWQLGRAALPDILAKPDCPENPGGPYPYVSSSDVPIKARTHGPPRALTHDEILEYIELFGQAAHNAVHRAGFDGVEIHGAHGYLVDQFTQNVCNKRTDMWGGSLENRTRFAMEVIKKITSVVGEERTAIRLSPFAQFQDMYEEHPQLTFAYLVARIREAYPRFSYIHIVEPRAHGNIDRTPLAGESTEFLRSIWKGPTSLDNGSVYLAAGGYKPETALEDGENDNLIVFGRSFISNPDLPARVKKDIPFTPYNRDTFYNPGSPEGYITYTFSDKESEELYEAEKRKRDRNASL